MVYAIEFKPSAFRQFESLSENIQKRLKHKIDALSHTPRPRGVEKLAGAENLYRIRVGDYRIIYEIQDSRLIVLVVKVGHRKDISGGVKKLTAAITQGRHIFLCPPDFDGEHNLMVGTQRRAHPTTEALRFSSI